MGNIGQKIEIDIKENSNFIKINGTNFRISKIDQYIIKHDPNDSLHPKLYITIEFCSKIYEFEETHYFETLNERLQEVERIFEENVNPINRFANYGAQEIL